MVCLSVDLPVTRCRLLYLGQSGSVAGGNRCAFHQYEHPALPHTGALRGNVSLNQATYATVDVLSPTERQ